MNYYFIPAAIIAAIVIIFVLSIILKRPIRGFGLVFVILFLATLTGQLWITPFGPSTYGVSWIPLIVVGTLMAFLILALSPNSVAGAKKGDADEGPLIVAGFFFWLLLILMVLAIGIGYYRSPMIAA